MARAISLKGVLARQWIIFALLVSAIFVGLLFFFMYVLEDYVFDSELARVAATIRHDSHSMQLPRGMQYFAAPDLAADIGSHLSRAEHDEVVELRRKDGTYVHARWAQHPSGASYALVYDVTDKLAVTRAARGILMLFMPVVAGLMLLAYLLASSFVSRISEHTRDLLEQVRNSRDPATLRAFAARERIAEFAELARLNADAWQEKLQTIEQEQRTLAYLGHELRTPLQSARTSIELLQPDATSEPWQRLRRAVNRLDRASSSILWLATDAPPPNSQATEIAPILSDIVDELRPLAQRKGQTVTIEHADSSQWRAPGEIIESLLANVLLNAVQHGAGGPIRVALADGQVSVSNLISPENDAPGFGMGLQIVQRLCDRFGLAIQRESGADGGLVRCCVSLSARATV